MSSTRPGCIADSHTQKTLGFFESGNIIREQKKKKKRRRRNNPKHVPTDGSCFSLSMLHSSFVFCFLVVDKSKEEEGEVGMRHKNNNTERKSPLRKRKGRHLGVCDLGYIGCCQRTLRSRFDFTMAIAPVVQLLVVVAVCVLLRWIPIAFCFCFCDRHHTARALDEELVGSQYGLSGASQTSNSRGIFFLFFLPVQGNQIKRKGYIKERPTPLFQQLGRDGTM